MPNFRTCIATKTTIVILTYFLFSMEVLAQENRLLTSPFKICWTLETDKMTSYEIESDNESNIYVSFLSGKIASINLKTGKKNWESELGGEIVSPPNSDSKNIYIASRVRTAIHIHSISKDLGITNWQTSLDFTNKVFLIKYNNKLIILGKEGKSSVIDKNNGKVIWSKNLGLELSSTPIIFENQIILGTLSKQIFFYSIEDGKILSQFETPSSPNIISVIKNRYLFWGDYKGNAYLKDLTTKKIIWKIRSGAEIANILATQQDILISSLDNFIYLISIKTGKSMWKKRFTGRLLSNFVIIDRYAIIVTFTFGVADIIDIESGKLVNQFSIGDDNYFINKPLFSNGLFVFPTIKGLIAFTNTDLGIICPIK